MNKTLTYILITASVVFWGLSFILTKELFLTEPRLGVTTLITLRLAIATAITLPAILIIAKTRNRKSGLRIKKGHLKWFLLLALCEPFIYHLCETSGVQRVSGSLSSVVIATIPLFVPFGMWIAYRQRISLPVILGVVLSLIGVGIMLPGGERLTASLQGLTFLSGAVVIAVVYTILLVKIVDHYPPIVITTWQNLIGLLYFTPLLLATGEAPGLLLLSWSPRMILMLLALGILCSTLAYAFYNRGVRTLGASQACIFNNAIPIFSLTAAIAIGQETFSWGKLLGMAIVIIGVAISQSAGSKK